ncbi:glycosyl hydrolase family 115 (putative glucuronidase) [Prosthecobacter fusiformis]|uniref:Glycosyl hydrolase family 115 (Putative glucuronidase) n=1 Tax=Prosthecobacter fusiformis TaxID=48464 RepID=A0A4R7RN86_9BACT|nr:glycosyl hydrolase 115 family protein [Prosthecobacter fusiformis]TDU66469.1 glycosyl hydrolase family 115 (putative glucuronidase) [Prosthecobacter fusiformis]
MLDTSLTAGALRLPPGVPVIVDESEPLPVQKAAHDLCRDLEWVLKVPSPLMRKLPDNASPAIVISSSVTEGGITGPESHAIIRRGSQVQLLGTDMRGTIYAIYSFCERFLDIPPWWFWAEWKPKTKSQIEIPEDAKLTWQSPQVRWRGWFPNDTDLLSPWIQRNYATHWDRVLETMLRLKLNLLDVGEFSDDSLRKLRVPRDRGLAVTTTHLAPFGASLRDWAKFWTKQGRASTPPLRLADMPQLEQFWEHHIRLAQQEKVEMIWMIGLRGDGDKGFYKSFTDAPPDDAARARVLQDVLHRQIALLQRVTGEQHPLMRTVIYDEASDYMAAGLLHPPELPSLIWNFSAARHDHFPAADLRNYRAPSARPLGYYFNVQFTNTGSHLADGEGPWKMEQNHRMLLESGPNLQLSIVNSGNIREFPLSLSAHASMMWDFASYTSDRFLADFCKGYWGAKYGPQIDVLYRDFFNAYWQQRKPDIPGFPRQYIFHDLRVVRAARDLMRATLHTSQESELLGDRGIGYYRIVPENCDTTSKVEAVIQCNQQAAERFAQVARRCDDLAPHLGDQGQQFFNQSLRAQARFMAAASACTAACAEAYKARNGKSTYDQWMRKAQVNGDGMAAILKELDATGPLQDWYSAEKIFGLPETLQMIQRRVSGNVKVKSN